MAVLAVQHVRRMRGGAQGHMMRCSDGNFYVVKFRNNPQHLRVLANELLATRLAEAAGLPVPSTEVVEVDDWLVQNSSDLNIQLSGSVIPCQSGLQFGSRYVVDPLQGQIFDYFPATMLERVRNLEAFAGMLALDKWTANSNGRQATFWRKMREKKYTVTFIDQGYCFNAGEWSFPDSPLRGVYARNCVYKNITSWDAFEPTLSRAEQMDIEAIWQIAAEIPEEWYESDHCGLHRLVEDLYKRRGMIRDLIAAFRTSSRNPFPNWAVG